MVSFGFHEGDNDVERGRICTCGSLGRKIHRRSKVVAAEGNEQLTVFSLTRAESKVRWRE